MKKKTAAQTKEEVLRCLRRADEHAQVEPGGDSGLVWSALGGIQFQIAEALRLLGDPSAMERVERELAESAKRRAEERARKEAGK